MVALFKKKNLKVHTGIRITSSLRATARALITGAETNRVHTSFLAVKWHHHICLIYNMFLKSAPNRSINVVGKVMHFARVGSGHVPVYFDVMETVGEQLLIGKLFIDRFLK